ncbi:MAG: porin [Chloroherpetonaceae bacterium]
MRTLRTVFALLVALIAINTTLFGQGMEKYGGGARINLNEDKSHYIRFITWAQIWARYQQMNPGSIVNSNPVDDATDIGLRRGRFLAYGSFGTGSLFMFHIGINNQTWIGGGAPGEPTGPAKKPQLFIHDMWYEQKIVDRALYLGFGLHYWWGISREANASTLNFLALDAPIYNWPLIEASDQFARQYGMYIKGQLFDGPYGRLDYRAHINKPFKPGAGTQLGGPPPQDTTVSIANASTNNAASFNPFNNTLSYGAYLTWQFLDNEPDVLPFEVGTYLGTKRVFDIGFGFYYHPKGSATTTNGTVTGNTGVRPDSIQTHDQLLLGFDVFFDLPFGEGDGKSAWTLYSVLYKYDFGPNYIRNIAIMPTAGVNPATPQENRSLNGLGAGYPHLGTGIIFRTETGYLLSKNIFNYGGRLQPFATINYLGFDRLEDKGIMWEVGANYLIEGHHAKYSAMWRQRPVYRTTAANGNWLLDPDGGSKGELIFQAMVYF